MLKRFFIQGLGRYLLLLPVPLVWIALGWGGGLKPLRDLAADWRFRLRGPIEPPVRLVYVDIDSPSIKALGNFPWNHELFAEVCSALVDAGKVKAIGVDVVMSDQGVPRVVDRAAWDRGHVQFGKLLFGGAPVVMAGSYAGMKHEKPDGTVVDVSPLLTDTPIDNLEPPETAEWKVRNGMILNPPLVGLIDSLDGDTRTVPLHVPLPGRPLYSLGLELARLARGLPRSGIMVLDDRIELRDEEGTVALAVPMRDRQLLDINWFSRWEAPGQDWNISFSHVLDYAQMRRSEDANARATADAFFSQDGFAGSVVLIGPVDRLLQDLAPTPFDDEPVPKVGVHGNVLKTILSGRFIKTVPTWAEALITLALTGAVTALVLSSGRRGLWSRVAAIGVAGGYVAGVFVVFAKWDLILPMVVPVGAALSTSFLGVMVQLIIEEKQKSRIKGMFGTYVAPELVDRMISSGEEPKLGGVEADITAYFSDIRNFSTFSEKLTPPRLVELMNEYLSACTDIVQAEGGTLDKYIGDAVVAIYGAPLPLADHAFRACEAALKVQARIAELRAKWTAEGDKWPGIVKQLQTRIGLNSGPAVVGNMGSTTRFNYTMMGDTVNLGARMETAAKTYGVFTMVTDFTKAQCELHGGDRIVFRYLDQIQVKGRAQPVSIYEVVGFKDDIADATRECIALFEQAAELYRGQRWDEAAALFRRSADLEPNYPGITGGVTTNPSLVFIERCLFMRANPPVGDWDGVFVMTTK